MQNAVEKLRKMTENYPSDSASGLTVTLMRAAWGNYESLIKWGQEKTGGEATETSSTYDCITDLFSAKRLWKIG